MHLFLSAQGTEAEWRLIFFICAAIIIGGTVFYLLVAEGEVQDWAKPKTNLTVKSPYEQIPMIDTKDGKDKIETNGNATEAA